MKRLSLYLFVLFAAVLPVFGSDAASSPAKEPTREELVAKVTELETKISDLQLAVQAVRQQRDQAVQSMQDQQAQSAIEKAKSEQSKK